jgi:predicted DNA-binding protein with PD1-like motif
LGLPDGSTRGGHLFEAHVWPTLEMVLTAWPERVRRKGDMETGLYLLDP